jgi:7,8-dihydropterin-6-yl-methyl-4-(beta-D-ribofuranosyl)aminobenzene 5'-phosphate synthase
MIIKVLAENTSATNDLCSEHGLSLYIETKGHKLLFDTGASAFFAENAIKMNVDLSAVDLAVISHGHYDHGGGLKTFLNINTCARV